jgi:UDP-glucose 4-epimerase
VTFKIGRLIVPRTAVVTGGAGFIGSHVVDRLLAEGSEVVVLDDLSTGDPRRVAREAELEEIDIADASRLDQVVDSCSPWAIFHLAAQSSVTVSVADPRRDAHVNVIGTLNVLEAARRHRAPVVFTSTGGALYGDSAPLPTPEDRIPAPLAPYGASKWAGEAYVVTWAASSDLPHAVCRLGNVYGPRQSPHGEAGVVSILSHRLWSDRRPTLFGFGKPTRDYVEVSDVAEALLRAVGTRGIFNIATGIETPVEKLYEELENAAGKRMTPELAPLRAGELARSCMNPTLAQVVLQWRAEVTLMDGLRKTYRALVAEFERDEPA